METYMVTTGGEYYPRHHQEHQYQEQTHLGDQDQEHRRHQAEDKQEQAGQARQQQVGHKEDNFLVRRIIYFS